MRNYVDDSNLQIAMTEYNDNSINREVKDQYDRSVGTVTQVYNNTGHVTLPPGVKELEALRGSVTGRTMETVSGDGEQVYAVVKNPKEKAEDVEENYAIL
jgi:hypothetical protein